MGYLWKNDGRERILKSAGRLLVNQFHNTVQNFWKKADLVYYIKRRVGRLLANSYLGAIEGMYNT